MGSWSTTPTGELAVCGPGEMVPGDSEGMRAVAARLQRVAVGADSVRALLARVDAGEWVGEAGAAFRDRTGELPAPYDRAAQAFGLAARALTQLADTIDASRATARAQLVRFEMAEVATRRWEHEQQLWDESGHDPAVHAARTGLGPPGGNDPGAHDRDETRRVVAQAQQDVRDAERRAAIELRRATELAPREGDWGSFARGLHAGTVGVGRSLWDLSPLGEDPGGAWSAFAQGLLGAARDPGGALRQAVGQAVDDPYAALGAALPGVLVGGSTHLVREHRSPDVVDRTALTDHGSDAGTPLGLGSSKRSSLYDEPGAGLSYSQVLASGDPVLVDAWRMHHADKVAAHAYRKHVLEEDLLGVAHPPAWRKDMPWISSPAELRAYVQTVMTHPSASYTELPGTAVFWDERRKTMLIVQDDPHWGTVYPPERERAKYDEVVRGLRKKVAAAGDAR